MIAIFGLVGVAGDFSLQVRGVLALCVRVCVRVCVRACVRVCVCVYLRECG